MIWGRGTRLIGDAPLSWVLSFFIIHSSSFPRRIALAPRFRFGFTFLHARISKLRSSRIAVLGEMLPSGDSRLIRWLRMGVVVWLSWFEAMAISMLLTLCSLFLWTTSFSSPRRLLLFIRCWRLSLSPKNCESWGILFFRLGDGLTFLSFFSMITGASKTEASIFCGEIGTWKGKRRTTLAEIFLRGY